MKSALQSLPPKDPPAPWGTGWKADAPDDRDYKAGARFGAPKNLPAEALALVDHVARVKDQKNTESCVGQAIGSGLDCRLSKLGFARAESSSAAIYKMALGKNRTDPKTPLIDDGCWPRDAMSAIAEIGVPSAADVPFDPATITEELAWDAFQAASKFIVFQWFKIFATGASRADEVANTIAQGYPVVCGITLDPAFYQYQGGTIMQWGAEKKGGHMVMICGYRTRSDGRREFLFLNSWGTGWGEGGFFWVHEDALGSSRVSDVYALVVSP